jgi:glutamyl-tRNA synthetase/glutamyl-Q tRNA(Asp) synthetase
VQIDDGREEFDDLLLGRVVQTPAEQCGDILLRDRDGHWTYQFAVTVDDLCQEVTLVIRGEDLLSSTGRQIKLGRMLGRVTPASYLHHRLILKQGTALSRSGRQQGTALSGSGKREKLSKAAGDTGVRQLRAAGLSAPDVIGRAAAAVGLVDTYRPITAQDVGSLLVRRSFSGGGFQGAVSRRTYSP